MVTTIGKDRLVVICDTDIPFQSTKFVFAKLVDRHERQVFRLRLEIYVSAGHLPPKDLVARILTRFCLIYK